MSHGKQKVISKPITKKKKVVDPPKAERIMFDKAEQAEQNQNAINTLRSNYHEIDEAIRDTMGDEKTRLEELSSKYRSEIEEFENSTNKDGL